MPTTSAKTGLDPGDLAPSLARSMLIAVDVCRRFEKSHRCQQNKIDASGSAERILCTRPHAQVESYDYLAVGRVVKVPTYL